MLSLPLPFSPLYSYSYADVILTDEEAESLNEQIQLSKMELQNVKEELAESKKESAEQKAQLADVKNTSSEQKKSYETQLNEAEKKNQTLKMCLVATSTTSVIFAVLTVVLLCL